MTKGRRVIVRALFVAGGMLAGFALVAGHTNRNVGDGPTFAEHVDAVRRDDAVAAQVGEAMSDQILGNHPDLIVLAPLVESLSVQVAGSDALTEPVQRAAERAHAALTEPGPEFVEVTISDGGAIADALDALAPTVEIAPSSVAVSVVSIDDQAFAGAAVDIARVLDVLAWLLPLAAGVCLVGAVALARDRWRAAMQAGWALTGAAAGVGVVLVIGGLLVRRLDVDTLHGAVGRGAWDEFVRPMWWGVAVLALVGSTFILTFGSAAATMSATPQNERSSPRIGALVASGVAIVLLLLGVAMLAQPGDDVAVDETTGGGEVCNGHAELCERTFDSVAYVASHNSMSVAGAPGWYLAEQRDPIVAQLDQGVRALLVDVWSGRPTDTVVKTSPGSYVEARAVSEEELGPEVVRTADRIDASIAGEPEGAEARYMCHGLCETGSTPFLETLIELRVWMEANPDEVVTLFIEDHVDPLLIAADVEAAGLLPSVHHPDPEAPWPTLGEMIRTGRRLVVMLEEGHGGTTAPWLVNGFAHTQDTPYTFPTIESFSCAPNRGSADAPLLLLNHWLSGFSSLVTDAQQVNVRDVLLERAEQCRDERGQIPNFVAVNYTAIGDVMSVVDELNGVA